MCNAYRALKNCEQVQTALAPAQHNRHHYCFCSGRCRDRFVANQERFSRPGAQPARSRPLSLLQVRGVDGQAEAELPVLGALVGEKAV
jgi:hypothetical protein